MWPYIRVIVALVAGFFEICLWTFLLYTLLYGIPQFWLDGLQQ